MADDDAIGFVRAHRWATVAVQTRRLKEAGCSRVFDLDKHDRDDMERLAGRRRVPLLYAFLLARPELSRGMWADFLASLSRIEARGGVVVDLDTGLGSDSKAFRDVVRGEIRRHLQGESSADNARQGKSGREPDRFSRGDWRKAREIWKDVATYPTWDAAADALATIKAENTNRRFTKERAYLKWGARPRRKE